jgi:hypothetical protein
MRALGIAVMLFGLAHGAALACDEECAPDFVFDDRRATCVRATTS